MSGFPAMRLFAAGAQSLNNVPGIYVARVTGKPCSGSAPLAPGPSYGGARATKARTARSTSPRASAAGRSANAACGPGGTGLWRHSPRSRRDAPNPSIPLSLASSLTATRQSSAAAAPVA